MVEKKTPQNSQIRPLCVWNRRHIAIIFAHMGPVYYSRHIRNEIDHKYFLFYILYVHPHFLHVLKARGLRLRCSRRIGQLMGQTGEQSLIYRVYAVVYLIKKSDSSVFIL